MRSLYQGYVRVHLCAIEHTFRPRGWDVEVANDEVRWKLGEHGLRTRSKIEQPEVLVADFTPKNHERLRITKKSNPSRATRQQHGRQRVRSALCGGGSQGKGRSDICAGIDQKSTIGRPDWVDGILRHQGKRRVAIQKNKCQVRLAVADNCRHDRSPIRCPGRITPQCERVGHYSEMRAIIVHRAQQRSAAVVNRESDVSPIWCNSWSSNDPRMCAAPDLAASCMCQRPNALFFTSPRYIQERVRTNTWCYTI